MQVEPDFIVVCWHKLYLSSKKMGLEGVFLNQTMEHFGGIGALHMDPLLQSGCSQAYGLPFQLDDDNTQLPLDLMIQVYSIFAYIKKNIIKFKQ